MVHRRHPGPLRGLRLARDPGRGRPRPPPPWTPRSVARSRSPIGRRSCVARRSSDSARRARRARPPRTAHRSATARSRGRATRWAGPIRPSRSPGDVYAGWDARERGSAHHREWRSRFDAWRAAFPREAAEFERRGVGRAARRVGGGLRPTTLRRGRRGGGGHRLAQGLPERPGGPRTMLPELIGGSADLTGSNLTQVERVEGAEPRECRCELRLLRGARVRDERDLQRHRPARRLRPLRRHLPDVLGVRAQRAADGRADGGAAG